MKLLSIIVAALGLAVASPGQTNDSAPLFLHFGIEGSDSIRRLLSTRIHLGDEIFVRGGDDLKLIGRIEVRGTNIVADLMGDTGSQNQYYRGVITLETPFFAQGGAASGGVVPMWFIVSTNADGEQMPKRIKEMTEAKLKQIK